MAGADWEVEAAAEATEWVRFSLRWTFLSRLMPMVKTPAARRINPGGCRVDGKDYFQNLKLVRYFGIRGVKHD